MWPIMPCAPAAPVHIGRSIFICWFPGAQRVRDAHQLSKRIEDSIDETYPGTETVIHIEPVEDPDAWLDSDLIDIQGTHPAFDLPDFLQLHCTHPWQWEWAEGREPAK